jgi:hypothetical protein
LSARAASGANLTSGIIESAQHLHAKLATDNDGTLQLALWYGGALAATDA